MTPTSFDKKMEKSSTAIGSSFENKSQTKKMRLQKFLSQAGICSRRKGEEFITSGLIKVNDVVVTELGRSVDIENDEVKFHDNIVRFFPEKKRIYIAINKPIDVITSCVHFNYDDKIVLDLVDISDRIYPVGRLDKDSTGLLILTNDGELHNKLSHPSYNHEKEYIVTTVEPVSKSALEKMANGVVLNGKRTRAAQVEQLSRYKFRIILKQGVNRQIRRMVAKTGNQVKELIRIRIGSIKIGNLKQGEWRFLNPKEIDDLKRLLGYKNIKFY